MRRRVPGSGGLPEQLLRYDWRDWRPEPGPDDPAPWYSCWYLGLFAWREARQAWAQVRGLDERVLPERVTPPTPDLLTASHPSPEEALYRPSSWQGLGPNERPKVAHRSRPIKLR